MELFNTVVCYISNFSQTFFEPAGNNFEDKTKKTTKTMSSYKDNDNDSSEEDQEEESLSEMWKRVPKSAEFAYLKSSSKHYSSSLSLLCVSVWLGWRSPTGLVSAVLMVFRSCRFVSVGVVMS